MIYSGWAESIRPETNSATSGARGSADSESSRNYGGIKDPAVDALIERVLITKDRDDLIAATHALDRVLLANHYVVPGMPSGLRALRAGIVSPTPIRCRNIPSVSRPSGGGTPTRRRR